ncbi:transcriptional regulator [Acidihalobacter aeolianus]|uniref:Transcriptional regulator n=1 Tax=Acidihalobacter aeolianus TaxID=2792603 RepID=A0A1D8K4M5_9GAMM|nr:MarR family transcriptional regulator [Acidihalobacter aeolianus]AOV15911.1 transcriptional regulator [Acidihalobacter aeolianus]
MKTIVIGVMPQEKIRERMMAIARGEYKPKASDPKVWFPSMRSLAEVLSDENQALLTAIKESRPKSITELAVKVGRKPGNLSRTLKTLSQYGLVELQREDGRARPVVHAKNLEFRISV